jgi:uncharacterized protein YgiM (DUF1202 family)
VATVLAVGVGVATSGATLPSASPAASGKLASAAKPLTHASLADARLNNGRTLGVSRSSERVRFVAPVPKVTGKLWTTSDLNLRLEPQEKARVAGLVDAGKQVGVTGRRQGAYAQVVVDKAARWVTADYLSKDKSPAAMGLSDQPCPDGSSIESALQPASVKVYRAVCAAFPELTTYGGQDGHGEHVNGEAIDFMVPSSSVGQRVADFVYAHHAELDLFDIIWSQHIWTIQRAGEGFRSMSDRGSATANHYDHVHIKIN